MEQDYHAVISADAVSSSSGQGPARSRPREGSVQFPAGTDEVVAA